MTKLLAGSDDKAYPMGLSVSVCVDDQPTRPLRLSIMHADGSDVPRNSSKFNFSDSDIIFESCDGVRFRLHRKNLEVNTKGFPALDSGSKHDKGDAVKLTETAETLEILFHCIYPRRPPDISALGAESLLALAGGVQKYQVFSAMYACEIQIRKHVETHPMLVLVHTLKHYTSYEGTDLVDEYARLLVRKGQTVALLGRFAEEGLNTSYIVRWVEYEIMWEDIFKALKSEINALGSNIVCAGHSTGWICIACRNCMICWVDSLRNIGSTPALQEALDHSKFLDQHFNSSHEHCHDYCKYNECLFLERYAKRGSDLLKAIPNFTSLIGETLPRSGNSED